MAKRTYISVYHGLELLPLTRVASFGIVRNKVSMRQLAPALSSRAVPGTVAVSGERDENGIYQKTITYRRRDLDFRAVAELEALERTDLLAIYTDPAGNRRLCGTPGHPLRLTFRCADSFLEVTLAGKGRRPDAFLP